MIINQIEEI